MKIVNIIGGLGNQMFQFAFALSLKQRWTDEDVFIDTSHFKHIFINKVGAANLHNGFEISRVFPNANLPIADAAQLKKLTRYIPNYVLSRLARKYLRNKKTEIVQRVNDYFAYDPEVLDKEGDVYYEGIWESVQYHIPIRGTILRVFAHPEPDSTNETWIQKLEKENSVGIHIRRGDYKYAEAFRGLCELDYYKKALMQVLADGKEHSIYIFSNDILWCEENIKPLISDYPITMVTHNTGKNSCWDMFLMTHCKDLIIANSSFSWWGAFLNQRGGRVIAPNKWVNRDAEVDIWMPEWIRV